MVNLRYIHECNDTARNKVVRGWFIRVWLTVMLLCCLSITGFGALAQTEVRGEYSKKECVTRRDRLQSHMLSGKPAQKGVLINENGAKFSF